MKKNWNGILLFALLGVLLAFTAWAVFHSGIRFLGCGILMDDLLELANPALEVDRRMELASDGTREIIAMVIPLQASLLLWMVAFSILLGVRSRSEKTEVEHAPAVDAASPGASSSHASTQRSSGAALA